MATKKFTKTFNETSINEFIDELKGIRGHYDEEEEAANVGAAIFTWFGLIGGPAVTCAIAGLASAGLGAYYDMVQNSVTTAIEEMEEYKDYLQDHDQFDLIKLEMTVKVVEYDGKTAYLPKDFNVIGLHTNGGWLMVG